jgi:predicted  nucleic acid-binding Zn-ribbon protein
MKGVVVHRNHRAHSFALAMRGGRLVAIHASRNPSVGRQVIVAARRLRNGTFAANTIAVGKHTRRALIRGVVTFVDRSRGLFTVSAEGVSVLVHRSAGARAADALPSVGEQVAVETEIDDQGDLQDENVQDTGAQTQNMDLEGAILAIDPVARTLTVSADDDQESNQSVTVVVPATVDISTFSVGQEVELAVTLQSDGSFLLQASAGDDNAQEANDPTDEQGGCQGDGGDSSSGTACSGGSSGSGSDGSGDSGSGISGSADSGSGTTGSGTGTGD